MTKKLPPLQKIYEAYSAIADGRVAMGEGRAEVASSDGGRIYTVTWEADRYCSNDNGTFWQGYAGYPVLAVLMLQGRLPLDRRAAGSLAGVPWKKLNLKHKNDYQAALDEALAGLESRGADRAAVERSAREAYGRLRGLDIAVGRGYLPRPGGSARAGG